MVSLCCVAGLPLISALALASSAAAATPAASFAAATRHDLEGNPQLAFAEYMDAAEAGLPVAQFNVGVMLDSGRGVNADLAQAAVWYARAAAHGLPRAAYNLGQLYETGQGVPRNGDLAKAWFAASRLPASHDHPTKKRLEVSESRADPIAPDLVAPASGSKIEAKTGGVELVWTARAQPGPAQYFVELNSVEGSGPRELFSTTTRVSSVYVAISGREKSLAWRVTTLAKESGQYAASKWSNFQVE